LADLLTKLIKDRLGLKRVRGDTFGYVQRSFLGCVSDVDQREAREVGEKAVQFAMWDGRDGSVTIHRIGDYAAGYQLTDISEIAAKTKVMPDAFIAASGNGVTPAFHDYLAPLLGSDMPVAGRLAAAKVAKILKP
jgi:6-phosphofructokinase 1